ncbi:MAG: Ig-like domain-containing protein [Limnohabitans sp.]|nr:Ig-like domain-containing protein [Limnohabitans sp.]
MSTSDFITSDQSLSYSGTVSSFTANGAAVLLVLTNASGSEVGRTFVTPAANGSWTWDNTGVSRDSGNYTLTATLVDAAGNTITSAVSDSQIVTIDTDGSKNTDNGSGSNTPQTDVNTSATVSIDTISNDSGASINDFVTNDTTLSYNGSVTGFTANGDVVKLELQDSTGAVLATHYVTPSNTGAWTWDNTGVTRESGNYTLVATIVDKAGNRVNTAAAGQDTQVITIDNQADKNTDNSNGSNTPQPDSNSTTASVTISAITDDTGSSATDFVTADPTLGISGTVSGFSSTGSSAGDQLLVQIKDNSGAVVATQYVKPDSSGNWTMNNQANTLADGKYTITVDVVDLAGNTVKAGDTRSLIVDTNKGGTDAGSNTNSGTGAAETDANVTNNATVTIGSITDDTGISTADFITSDGSLVIAGSVANFSDAGTALGDTVRVQVVDATGKVVAQQYVAPTGTNGSWTFDNQGQTLADGNYTLKAAIVDKAGNVVKAAADKPMVISNTAAPTSATVAISAISDDTGTSTVDFITADNTLTFSGTTNGFSSSTNQVLVQVLKADNSIAASGYATVDASGNWTLVSNATTNAGAAATLADGQYTIRAVLTNLAGTAEVTGSAVTEALTIDTSAGSNPDNGNGSNGTDVNTSATVTISAISQDTGSSTTDFVTSDNSLVITGSTSGFSATGGSAGDKVRVQIFDNTGTLQATQFVTPDANGLWSMDNTSANLADGKYTIQAVIVDAAGNAVNTLVSKDLLVDTNKGGTDPSSNTDSNNGSPVVDPNAGSTVAVAIGSITDDSGFSATDFITNDNTLSITGTVANFSSTGAAAGDTVRVQVVNAQGTVVAEQYVAPTGANGSWTLDNTTNTLADGNYTIKAAIVDKSGNVVKAALDQPLVVNTGNTPTTATLAISSIDDGLNTTTAATGSKDTGTSASDFITSDNTLTITGTTDGLAIGSTDKVFVKILSGTTVVSSGYATLASGANPGWTFAADATHNASSAASLADGQYTIQAVYTNAAGTTISQPVTRNLAIDTGASNNPDNNPSVDPNANVTLSIDAISTDSGSSATDFVTNDQTLVISGNAPGFTSVNGGAGDVVRVQIFDNAATPALVAEQLVTVDANGQWSWDRSAATPLNDGQYTIKASILDAAGNTVKTATDKPLVIDSDASGKKDQPSGTADVNTSATITIGGIDDGLSTTTTATGSKDTGTSASDLITQDGTLTFSGTTGSFSSANGSKVHLQVVNSAGDLVVDQYLDVSNNTWTYNNQANGSLADGAYTIQANIVDKAGNTVVAASPKTLVIDSNKGGTDAGSNPANNATDPNAGSTVSVSVTSIDDGDTSKTSATGSKDSGTLATDFVTNDNTLVIRGTTANFSSTGGANNDRVRVQLLDEAGTTVIAESYVLPDSTGAWSWDRTGTPQADGKYKVKADIVDAAGNVVKVGNTQDHTIDTSATNNPNNGSGAAGTDSNATSTLTLAITSIVDSGTNDSKDTGASATDFITNDPTLVIKGTAVGFSNTGAQAGDQLRVQIVKADGTVVRSDFVTVDGSGNWTLNNTANTLAAGTYTVKADVVDLAGNTVKSATQPLTIDTTNSEQVSAHFINKDTASSVGVSNTDWKVYSDGSSKGQTIFGQISTGETLSKAEISIDGGSSWVAGDINADLVKFFIGGALSTGTKTFQYRTTDVAGNVSAVTTKDLVVEALPTSTTSSITAASTGVDTTLPTTASTMAFVGTAGNDAYILNADTIANYFVDAQPNSKWVHAGAGVDTLRINGAGTTLNLNQLTTQYTSTKLQGFEIIDMSSDSGAQTLIADATSLASIATAGWLTNVNILGEYQLVIRGNTGDQLILSPGDGYDTSGWDMGASGLPYATDPGNANAAVSDGRTYTRWTNTALKIDLLVDMNVSTSNKFVSITGISTDDGSSATDLITSDATLSFSGEVVGLSTGDVVKVTVIDSNNTNVLDNVTATVSNGVWTLDNQANTLPTGNYTVKVGVFTATGTTAVANAQDRIVQVIAVNNAPVSTDVDGTVAGDPFGAATAPGGPLTSLSTINNNGTFAFGTNSNSVTVSGMTGTILENTNLVLGDGNKDETATLAFVKPVSQVQINFSGLTNTTATAENSLSSEQLVVQVNGVNYFIKASNLSTMTLEAGTITPSGALIGPDERGFAGTITINASDVPGGVINSISVTNDYLSGSYANGTAVNFAVAEGYATPSKTVDQLFGSVYSDANNDTMQGVVITSAGASGNTLGKYQWSSNGTTWTDLPAGLSDSSSVYLAKTDLVRFVPSSTNTSSDAKPALTARLVDASQSSGTLTSGGTVDASDDNNGGSTAISGNTVGYAQVDAPVIPTITITGATTDSIETTEEFGPHTGTFTVASNYTSGTVVVTAYNQDGTQDSNAIRYGHHNNWNGGANDGRLSSGNSDGVLVILDTTRTSSDNEVSMRAKFESQIGTFKAISFDYADVQDKGVNSTAFSGANVGFVNFYDASGVLLETANLSANSIASNLNNSAKNFSHTLTSSTPATYFEIVTYHDLYGVDSVKFTTADTMVSGDTTCDTTPTLAGTLSSALPSGYTVAIYEGTTLLGNATVSGTGWTYDVPTTTVGTHTYTAKVMNGTTQAAASTDFVVKVAATPLVLDLNGDGVKTVGLDQGVQFDLLATGGKQNVGWVSKQDGLLVMDLNGDGQINNGSELFGDRTRLSDGTLAKDGWAALAAQDSNADGVINAQDANFAKMSVWVDANSNGTTEAGELSTLADQQISSISLAHGVSTVQQNGNVLDGNGSFTTTDGAKHAMTDVGFQVQNATSNVFKLYGGANLDLSGLGNAAIVSQVDMASDSAANTVKLTLADVLGTATTQGVHQLMLTGNANDTASLNLGEWLNQGTTVTQNGHSYAVYDAANGAAAQLLIDQHMLVSQHG